MANANKTLLCIASALALSACASDEHRQVAELSRAHTLVEQAQQAGAQQYAGADLEAANNKLLVADNKKTDEEVALRMATEASLDAQVALQRTRAAKAELALAQVNAGSDTLRDETTRPQTP